MIKEMKFTELRHYVASWECCKKTPEVAFGILMCIGYLRRECLEEEEITILRKVELMVRKDIEDFIYHYENFMREALLHEYAKDLDKELDEDSVDQFLQLRDESQMAFEIFQEYVGEENVPTIVLKKVKEYHLLEVDNIVLWDRRKVKAIQGLVLYTPTPPALDTEIFWWWSKSAYQDGCWLPDYFRDRWIAFSIDKLIEESQERTLQNHLKICSDCQAQYEITQAIVIQDQEESTEILSLTSDFNSWVSTQNISFVLCEEFVKMAASPEDEPKRWKGETPDGKTKWLWMERKGELTMRISSQNMKLQGCKLAVKVGPIQKECCLKLKLDQLIGTVTFDAEERKQLPRKAKGELVIL